jgi:restriction endonuclease XhoI-like protein
VSNYNRQIKEAIKHFWSTRDRQSESQGTATGLRDTGARSAVTGGKQMDGFVAIVRKLLIKAGLPDAAIFSERRLELPGYFRAEKKWDLVVVVDGALLAYFYYRQESSC